MDSFTSIPAPPADLQELASWLSSFTNWEKQAPLGADRRALGPSRCRGLLQRAGLLTAVGPTVQVAGTKGKGSTVLWMEALLRHRDCPTAATLSPHLVSIEERIRIDGQELAWPSLFEGLTNLHPYLIDPDQPQDSIPTFFDLWIALFIERAVSAGDRWLLLEVGMGGPLDSTSSVCHDVGILTTVDLDHRPILGDTIQEIAREKALIASRGKPFIIADGAHASDAADVAASRGAIAHIVKDDARIPAHYLYPQRLNGACALAALEKIEDVRPWTADEVRHAAQQLRLPARLEKLAGTVPLLLDGAHTPLSLAAFVERFECHRNGKPGSILLGMLSDKEIEQSLGALATLDPMPQIVTVTPDSPRALPAEQLSRILERLGVESMAMAEIPKAVDWLKEKAATGQPVAATGSMYLAGAVRTHWLSS